MEYSGGAVALVHITVENQHPRDSAAGQEIAADHRQVVEDAEPGRVVVVGVMGAAGQVAGQPMLKGLFGGQERAAHGAHRSAGQGFAPGQAKSPLVLTGQLAAHVAFDICTVVGQGENVRRTQRRAQQVGVAGQPAVHQVIAQQAKLVHGETVFRREVGAVVFVIDQWQRHGVFSDD